MEDNIGLFALVTNTLAKDKEIEGHVARTASARVFPEPRQSGRRRRSGCALEFSPLGLPPTYHRYYQLKAEWMGKDVLNYWDRNAPLPEADHTRIEWPRAREGGPRVLCGV